MWRRISEAMLAITAILFLGVLYFILRRRILNPVIRLSDVVSRLAAQDYAVDMPDHDQVDEIGDMAQALRVFQENGLERQRLERERDEEIHMRDLMSRMTQRMQSCENLGELGEVVARFVPEICPAGAGILYLQSDATSGFAELCKWQSPAASKEEFSPLACWALRRGVPHRFAKGMGDMPCQHVDELPDEVSSTLCLPLTAQQETIGLFYIERRSIGMEEQDGRLEPYLAMLAENIGLAIANLRLRDKLSDMAMLDALTGLPNRRKLEDSLKALRSGSSDLVSVSCLVLDVDHFKKFNDRFGHEAGDAVLRQVGGVLKNSVRGNTMAFRFGGEEFVVLIADTDSRLAVERAEHIRRQIAALDLHHDGDDLGKGTVSIGVANAPEHASVDRLVGTADAALLRAKQEGRDRVVLAATRRSIEQSAG
mgnify:CR=1 FL=1